MFLQFTESSLQQLINLFFYSRCVLVDFFDFDVDVAEALCQQILPFLEVRVDLPRLVYALAVSISDAHDHMVRHLAGHVIAADLAVHTERLIADQAEQFLLDVIVLRTVPKSFGLLTNVYTRVLAR